MNKTILRDVFLRKLRLERSYRPHVLVQHPSWGFSDYLKLAVTYHLHHSPSDFTFLQIGAFDGLANDSVYPLVRAYGLRGVVVEPQPKAFEALSVLYADHPQVTVVNAAVADADGRREFYTSRSGPIQQASFDKQHLLRHKISPELIVSHQVRCVTIPTLLQENGLARLGLLQIDAEGHDYAILRSIDLDRLRPLIVRFEHAHMTREQCDESVARLAQHGYQFITERRDVIAMLDP